MCIFCKILNNEIPSSKIYEDDFCIAILDISQATKGHTLIISKKHFSNIYEIEEEVLSHIHVIAKKIALMLKKTYSDIKGFNIIQNNEPKAGQTVMHYHVHVIPRYENDDLKIESVDHSDLYDLKAIQKEIKKVFNKRL